MIHGVNAEIADGEFIVIVGPSGCGKITLLRMVAGLEEITGGEISIGGRVVNDLEPAERDIAMVFQNYALYPHMSVFDNMAYGLKIAKVPKAEIKARVDKAAKILELGALLARKPRELSGGQRQRVAMGRAIVRQPQVFLFDEPLSNLDAKLRAQTRLEIQKLHRELGITSLFVTHDQVEAMTLAERMIVMNAGRMEQIGTPEEVYAPPGHHLRRRLHRLAADEPAARPGRRLALHGRRRRRCRCRRRRRASGELMLGVRPEHVELGATSRPPAGRCGSRCSRCWAPSAWSTARSATTLFTAAHRRARWRRRRSATSSRSHARAGAPALVRRGDRSSASAPDVARPHVDGADWPYPLWIAHRGAGKLAPENTLAAFRVGAAPRLPRLRMRRQAVAPTACPSCCTTRRCERTTSGHGAGRRRWPGPSCRGSMPAAGTAGATPASRCPASRRSPRFCLRNGFALNIEIKPTPGHRARDRPRRRARRRRALWARRRCRRCSARSSRDALEGAREAGAAAAARAAARHAARRLARRGAASLGCVGGRHQLRADGRRRCSRSIHGAGLRALVYTVNDPAEATRLIALGIDGIVTDAVDRFSPGTGVAD